MAPGSAALVGGAAGLGALLLLVPRVLSKRRTLKEVMIKGARIAPHLALSRGLFSTVLGRASPHKALYAMAATLPTVTMIAVPTQQALFCVSVR